MLCGTVWKSITPWFISCQIVNTWKLKLFVVACSRVKKWKELKIVCFVTKNQITNRSINSNWKIHWNHPSKIKTMLRFSYKNNFYCFIFLKLNTWIFITNCLLSSFFYCPMGIFSVFITWVSQLTAFFLTLDFSFHFFLFFLQ